MSETTPPATQYAEPSDVVAVLGKMGPRIEAAETVSIPDQLAIAHTDVVDRLHSIYGRSLPEFSPVGRESVRWAVARLAAAAILDILRASMPSDVAEVPLRLRQSAWATIDGGVPGSPVGDAVPGPPPGVTDTGLPLWSSRAPGSNFPDPYACTDVDGYPLDVPLW